MSSMDGDQLCDALAAALLEKKKQAGTYEKLAGEIQRANSNADHLKLDRRKIARIVEKHGDFKRTPLTLYELQALDNYLKPEGGLAAVFETPTLLKSLAQTGRITFLLGAKFFETVDHISRWDVRAMVELLRAVDKLSPGVRTDIENIFLRQLRPGSPEPSDFAAEFHGEGWRRMIDDDESPSLVCVGSPRACHASEIMLAEMFNVAPFQRGRRAAEPQLPFKFGWTEAEYGQIPSTFAVSERELPEVNGEQSGKVRAMLIGQKILPVSDRVRPWRTYGVITAQRRRTGQVWLVLAGLSGTATYGCAQLVNAVVRDLPPSAAGEHSPVLWVPVVAVTTRDLNRPGDSRRVTDVKFEGQPGVWAPPAQPSPPGAPPAHP